MGLLRSLDHNEEQVCWAEQTEIELGNFLREFDATVWPLMRQHGYTKDAALNYWSLSHVNTQVGAIVKLLSDEETL